MLMHVLFLKPIPIEFVWYSIKKHINSANLVDIVLDVEDAFDIRLENDDMDQMQTVNDAMAIIDAKLKSK